MIRLGAPQKRLPRVNAALLSILLLTSCSDRDTLPTQGDETAAPPSAGNTQPRQPPALSEPAGSWAWALEGAWRPTAERALDATRKPEDIFAFMGVEPGDAVLETWPGGGWHAAILAPYLHANGGRYIAALPQTAQDAVANDGERETQPDGAQLLRQAFQARFDDTALFGPMQTLELGPETDPLNPAAPIDSALSVHDVHAWMALGMAEKAMADIYAALKPGGFFAVVEARAADSGPQDPRAASGYVQTRYVTRLAEDAGFVLAARSELLSNARDDRDHPFGVWTLAPYNRTSPLGAPRDPDFDRSAYESVGEPDRMLLLFRKPQSAAAAPANAPK